jgi:hypothetical protein
MNFQTIVIILVIVLVAYLINRNRSKANNNLGQGSERPTHDDPNIQGHGSFGRDRVNQSDNQNNSSSSAVPQASSHNDDPNIGGQGGFGRDKR